ncbi:MAG: hypothetical protein BWY63_02446 [Chloroflexi bacterium ADurb.Bin360]|nr:MAG: hypothetical protein BWY63_02446 [Chloroflexi bacterium ADurb.Bin360]
MRLKSLPICRNSPKLWRVLGGCFRVVATTCVPFTQAAKIPASVKGMGGVVETWKTNHVGPLTNARTGNVGVSSASVGAGSPVGGGIGGEGCSKNASSPMLCGGNSTTMIEAVAPGALNSCAGCPVPGDSCIVSPWKWKRTSSRSSERSTVTDAGISLAIAPPE